MCWRGEINSTDVEWAWKLVIWFKFTQISSIHNLEGILLEKLDAEHFLILLIFSETQYL